MICHVGSQFASVCSTHPCSPAQELGSCQHTLIGDETLGIKGISGGERRRVGIGLQVCAGC